MAGPTVAPIIVRVKDVAGVVIESNLRTLKFIGSVLVTEVGGECVVNCGGGGGAVVTTKDGAGLVLAIGTQTIKFGAGLSASLVGGEVVVTAPAANIVTTKDPAGVVLAIGTQTIKFSTGLAASIIGGEVVVSASGGGITGNPNRWAFFNHLGTLTDSAKATWNDVDIIATYGVGNIISVGTAQSYILGDSNQTTGLCVPVYILGGGNQITDCNFAYAFGFNNTIQNTSVGLALGQGNFVRANNCFAIGYQNLMDPVMGCFALGVQNEFYGADTFLIGRKNVGVVGCPSGSVLGIGLYAHNSTTPITVVGCYNESASRDGYKFIVGGGLNHPNRLDAFCIDNQHNAEIERGIEINESNLRQGIATLAGGTIVVLNATIGADDRIFITAQNDGLNPGFLWISARVPGVSFTIKSSNPLDNRDIAYLITGQK